MKHLMLVLLLITLTGCAGVTPLMQGSMKIERHFSDADSMYEESYKLPAGTDLTQVSNFRYEGKQGQENTPEYTEWNIGLESADEASTEKQADMLVEMNRAQMQMFEGMAKALEALANAIPNVNGEQN
jgi:hypothetical protein